MSSFRRAMRATVLAALLVALTAAPSWTQGLPSASPESVGLSTERLERVDRVMKDYVDRGRVAGVVTLDRPPWQGGAPPELRQTRSREERADAEGLDLPHRVDVEGRHEHRRAHPARGRQAAALRSRLEVHPGLQAHDGRRPATAGAAPNSPVASCPRSARSPSATCSRTPPACPTAAAPPRRSTRPPTSGCGTSPTRTSRSLPVIERLASLPFDAQPGEKYVYGFNTDILGAVVEKASGMPLDEFFRTRIFEPLKMVDTSFFLPPAKRDRLATVYLAKDGGTIERAPDPQRGQGDYVDGPRKCFSGGAGLLSTASDYARFLQMLVNGGELDGARLLSPKTVELATSNHARHPVQRGQDAASASASRSWSTSAAPAARLGRRVQLGRRVLHQLLGRPAGAARGGVHVADASGRQPGSAGQVPRAGVPVGRGSADRSTGRRAEADDLTVMHVRRD